MKKTAIVSVILFILVIPIQTYAANIRGDVVANIILTDSAASESVEFAMGIEEVFAVSIDRNSEIIKGIEIEFSVPSSLRSYVSSFAFDIYKGISPSVKDGIGTYYGQKYHSFILPETVKFYIQIPYKEKLPAESVPYTTVVNDIISYSDTPLMVTILPMMKGFPTSLYNSRFNVEIRPLLKDVGTLSLNVNIPEGVKASQLSVLIDGKSTVYNRGETNINLTEGNHTLTIESPETEAVNQSFSITKGKTTKLNLTLEKLESYAVFEMPDTASVYLDGQKQNLGPDNRVKIEPGMHTVLFKIGDYKISKNFNILPGKDCKISLFLDIFVEEN